MLGFGIIRKKQYRYYMNVTEAEAEDYARAISMTLEGTNFTNLENI